MFTRRSFLASAAASPFAASPLFAQQQVDGWPSKPIRCVFPTGAERGGSIAFVRFEGWNESSPGSNFSC